ncbi:hypothetical protein E2P63_03140 [Candidatus Bathyarchaeota archaeon]|nr:hypothetical protein E2P63_03140 [Candidatus Bathyarchaeota archaeon]
MSKKILVIPILVLTFVLLSIPVMAKPATKIEGVTAIVSAALIPDPASLRQVGHNIVFNKGTGGGTITLNIPGKGSLSGTVSSTWSGKSKWTDFPNFNPEATNIVRGQMVLTFTDAGTGIPDTTGTFEGMNHVKSIGLPPIPPLYVEYHMVLQGTGDFEGQTLKLSYAGAPPVVFEGTLIIPK